MNLREALTLQAPSLALQRAAADEIARLDALIAALSAQNADLQEQLESADYTARGEHA